MKKTHGSILFFSVFLLGLTASSLYGVEEQSIHFGSRQSALTVSNKAKLFVSSSGFTVDGTLAQNSGATVAGQTVTFDSGIFEHDGIGALMTGTYTPSLTQTIINGHVAYYNALDRDLTLNSGTLTLDNDFVLSDNIRLLGPGTINLNSHQLILGGYYAADKTWNTALTLSNATGVYLAGATALGAYGHWTFPGTARINGNGETLDLSAGGQITISAGGKLYLENIIIAGLGTDKGKINFGSATSELHLSNATLAIDADVEIASGKVIVDGPSTIVLEGNKLVFKTDGKLTVNDTVLWLESLNQVTYPAIGYLRFTVGATNYDVYDANGFNQANTTAAVTAGLLTLNDNALIKRTVAQSELAPSEQALLSGNLTVDVSLSRNFTIDPSKAITVNGNVTINGNGATVNFTRSTSSQLVIGADKTLTLSNITLSHIYANTISFGINSHLHFGDNVVLELSEEQTFASNTGGLTITPLLRILDATGGGANTLTIFGLSGKCLLTFSTPSTKQGGKTITQRPIQMGDNIISLENIDCKGLDASILTPGITADGSSEYPEVDLVGNATIDISGKKNNEALATEKPKTSLDIFVEGEGNILNVLRDGLNYGGTIVFGSMPINELHVNLNNQNLTTGRTGLNAANAINNGYPYFTLSGTGIGLYTPIIADSDPVAAVGTARLIFDNDNAAVEIYAADAFQIDTGAELQFKNLQLAGYPLNQNSANVIIGGKDSHLYGDVDATGSRLIRNIVRKDIKNRRQDHTKEFEKWRALEQEAEQAVLKAAETGVVETPEAQRAAAEERAFAATRTLSLPTALDRATIVNFDGVLKDPFNGNFAYDKSTLKSFKTFKNTGAAATDYTPFNLVLEGDNRVVLAATDMKLYRATKRVDSQLINVKGTGNEIWVNRKFTVKSNLLFGAGAELTFVFVNDGSATPTVVLDANCVLELEKNATLRFKGNGKVLLSNGALVYFRGDPDTSKYKVGSAANKPRLILTDGAVLDFVTKATANFGGAGRIEVSNGAKIAPSTVGCLNIGAPQLYTPPANATKDPAYSPLVPTGEAQFDDFDVVVNTGGEIRLDLLTSLQTTLGVDWTFKARVGIQYATATLSVEGGTVTVGNNCLFDLNVDSRQAAGSQLKAGRLRMLSFCNGGLFIKPTGKMTLAANQLAPAAMTWNGASVIKAAVLPFMWFAAQARMGGAGSVAYIDKKATNNLSGTFTPTNTSLLADLASTSAATLAGLMGAK